MKTVIEATVYVSIVVNLVVNLMVHHMALCLLQRPVSCVCSRNMIILMGVQ